MNTTTQDTVPALRRVDRLLAHYGESHQHPTNELIHFLAIPLIMLSLIGLMFSLHPWIAYAFVATSMVYYARLSAVFLLTMVAGSVVMLALVHAMGEQRLALSAGIFVVAWIFQFIGHKIEGKKPLLLRRRPISMGGTTVCAEQAFRQAWHALVVSCMHAASSSPENTKIN